VVWDRPELVALRDGPVVAFDVPTAELDADGSRFAVAGVDVRLTVPGAHNALNAAAALAACTLAGADPRRAAASLADFRGVGRRFQRLG
jgi:UDP-N-acetylmuramate--alanine ligase